MPTYAKSMNGAAIAMPKLAPTTSIARFHIGIGRASNVSTDPAAISWRARPDINPVRK